MRGSGPPHPLHRCFSNGYSASHFTGAAHYLLAIVDTISVFHPDGQIRDEAYEYAPFLGSRMHTAGVTCMS